MKAYAFLFLFLPMLALHAKAEVRVTQDEKSLEVRTPLYTLVLDKARGYVPQSLRDNRSGGQTLFSHGGLDVVEGGQNPKFIPRSWFAVPRRYAQAEAQVSCTVGDATSAGAEVVLEWSTGVGKVRQTLKFADDSRQINVECRVDYVKPVIHAGFFLESQSFSSEKSEGVFYPGEQRAVGIGRRGFCLPSPGGKFAWNPLRRAGFGLGTRDGEGTAYIQFLMYGRKEGYSNDMTRLSVYSRDHQQEAARSGRIQFNLTLLAGGTPAAAQAWLETLLPPTDKPLVIEKVWPNKVVYRPEEEATAAVTLRNPSDAVRTGQLICEAVTGLDEVRRLDEREVTLKPHQRLTLEIPWNTGQRQWGMAFRARLLVEGKEVDEAQEYAGVTDFAPSVSQVGILNPGDSREVGSEAGRAEMFRENYYGIIEYYCWMPDEILGLAPKGEQWHPHTESQGAYEVTLGKAFVQTLVRELKTRGIATYSMLSDFLSLPNILRHPELAQYTSDGQPYLYNGRIYDQKRRYAVGPANFFNADRVRQWAEETGDSIDMFGWGGCRWDCSFLPTAMSDPLHLQAERPEEDKTWHDPSGKASTALYPDPDRTGARLLRLWRQTVSRRHPDFIYGANLRSSEEMVKAFPMYFKEATSHSLILMEYLLNSSKPPNHTWQAWAKNLTDAAQRVRANGGQPSVGTMRGYLPGGVSLAMSQYLIFASGVHWGADAGPRYSLDDSWKRFAFALRYAEYYYDPAFKLMDEAEKNVTVEGNARVFWKQFVYERPRPGGRDVVVHLLNLPKEDFIIMHHSRPAVQHDIGVRLKLQSGERVARAAVLLPEPRPHAEALSVKGGGAVVPELRTAAIVVLEVRR